MADDFPTKAQLMDRITDSWEAMAGLLKQFDAEALSRPDPQTGWAVKDHLFHLAAWERGVAYLIQGKRRWEGMGVTPEEWRDLKMDETNERIFERNRDRSAAEALSALREAHQDMLDALAPLGDDDLRRPYASYDVDEGQFPDRPIAGWIIGDTFEHYNEHLGYFRSLLQS